MFVLGLVLLILLAALAIGIIANGTDPARFEGLGISLDTTVSTIFIIGLLMGLALLLSVGLMLTGTKRSVARRREVRALRREAAATSDVEAERRRLEAERERLAAERAQLEERRGRPDAPVSPTDGAEDTTAGRHAAETDHPHREGPRV